MRSFFACNMLLEMIKINLVDNAMLIKSFVDN